MKARAGFTLTEVMVAMAIIVAITAITVPIVRTVQKSAARTACLQKLRVLGAAVEGYSIDHGGVYPDLDMGRESRRAGRPDEEDEDQVLEVVLLSYVGNDPEAFHCPADHEIYSKTGSSYFWNHQMSGLPTSSSGLLGMDTALESIPLISDKEAFHGDPEGTNFVYADFSSTKNPRFVTGAQ